jgi:hypothetical protein
MVLDILLGVLGALAGGWLFHIFGTARVNSLNAYSFFVAVASSVVLLVLYHAFGRRSWSRVQPIGMAHGAVNVPGYPLLNVSSINGSLGLETRISATRKPGYRVLFQSGKVKENEMATAPNITLPEPLLAEVQSAAQAEHRSVDEVLTDAVKDTRRTLLHKHARRRSTAGEGSGPQGIGR